MVGAGEAGTGEAYLFGKDVGGTDNWGEIKMLTASDGSSGDRFANRLEMQGDVIVISARKHNAGVGSEQGAVYIFQQNEGGTDNWGEVKKIVADDASADDQFGGWLHLLGDQVLVSAYNSGPGKVYLIDCNAGGVDNWGQVQQMSSPDSESDNHFGIGLAIGQDRIIVGANKVTSVD